MIDGPLVPYGVGVLVFVSCPYNANAHLARDIVPALAALEVAGIVAIRLYFRRPADLSHVLAGIGAGLWCAMPMAALVFLHQHGQHSQHGWRFATPALLAILPLWGGDTAAYFVGRKWGKRLLAPAISPKKTWEGAIANLAACIAVAVPVAIWIGYAWFVGLACGLAAGVGGQLGDLFESYVKRRAGAKDSGALLPGHGGLLDRIDSLLFTAPVVAIIVSYY
jgi:phosphatidate cytidylyltransferase